MELNIQIPVIDIFLLKLEQLAKLSGEQTPLVEELMHME